MPTLSNLRISLFKDLSGEMLEKLLPLVLERPYEEGRIIYKKGEIADNFFILKNGRVVQEVDMGPSISASISTHTPGSCFGWSSLIPGSQFATSVICESPCDVLLISSAKLFALMEADHTLGYTLHKRICAEMLMRLNKRTEQLIRVLSLHPQLRHVVEQDTY